MAPVGAQGSSPTTVPPTTTAPPTSTTVARASTIEQQLREAYDEASSAEAATLDQYRASLEKTQTLDAQIAEIDAALQTVEGFLGAAKEKAATAATALAMGEAQRAVVQRNLDVQKARLEARAVRAYIGGDERRAQLEAILAATELHDLESTRAYTAAIVDDQLDAVQKVKTLEAEARRIRDALAVEETTIRTQRDAIAGYEKQIVTQRTAVAALRDAQAAETARQQTLLSDIRSRKASYLARLRALERESDGIAAVLRVAQRNQRAVLELPVVRTPLEKPVVIESSFGLRLHPVFLELKLHTGVDFDGTTGQLVRSAADGVVVFADVQDGYGNVVVVDHGDQIATVYAHMSRYSVKVGTTLKKGDVLGLVGSTGYSTGPHLHFEYRVSGAPVDPVPHIDFGEPLPGSCEALARSTLPADQEAFRNRPDCAAARASTTTTERPATTSNTVAPTTSRAAAPGAVR